MGFMALAAALGGVASAAPSVTIPASVSKDGTTTPLTTSSVAAVVADGTAPFTYSWVRTTGSLDITADTPTASSTAFSGANLDVAGETLTATFDCTVTDAVGRTAVDSITVTIQRYGTLSATAAPGSVSGSGNTATVTSNSSTCTASGGSGSFSYSWVLVSGGSVTAVSPSSATSTFRGSTMAAGETRTATFRCDVTDTISGQTASTGNVTISVNRYAALGGSASPTSVAGEGTGTSITSNASLVTATGGSGTYTYQWNKVSGGTVTAVSATSASSTFRGASMALGETRTAVFKCVITDSVTGSTFTTGNVSISVKRYATLTATTAPTTVSGSSTTATITSNSSTATAGGGSGSYSYAWTKVSGGAITAVSSTNATSTFRGTTMASPETRTAVFNCVITDTVTGLTATTANVSITLDRTAAVTFSPVPGSYSATGDFGGTVWSVTASQAVTWTWSKTGSVVTANVASGASATGITFSQNQGTFDKTSTVTLDASGAGTGSWTITMTNVGSGDTACVVCSSVLPSHETASLVAVNDDLELVNPATFARRKGRVTRADRSFVECVRITTVSGIELECSTTAPIGVQDGSFVLAPELVGQMVAVEDFGDERHEEVVSVEPIGLREVMHITVENEAFLAGKVKGRYLVHHNVKP